MLQYKLYKYYTLLYMATKMRSLRNLVYSTIVVTVLFVSDIGSIAPCHGQVVSVRLGTNPFQDAADLLRAADDEIYGASINENQIRVMFDMFKKRTGCRDGVTGQSCNECLSVDMLPSLLGINSTDPKDLVLGSVQDFGRVSMFLLHSTLYPTTGCNSSSYEDLLKALCQLGVMGQTNKGCKSLTLRQMDWILEQLNATYQPLSKYECFTGETIFDDAGIPTSVADVSELGMLFAHILHHVLQGHCIGESALVEPRFFIDDVFITYGNEDNVVTTEGFTSLLKDVGLYSKLSDQETHMDTIEPEPPREATTTPVTVAMTTETSIVVTTVPTLNVTSPMTTANTSRNSTSPPVNGTSSSNGTTSGLPGNGTSSSNGTTSGLPGNGTSSSNGTTSGLPGNGTSSSNGTISGLPGNGTSSSNVTIPPSGGNPALSPRRYEDNMPRWHSKKKRSTVVLEAPYDGNRCFSTDELFAIFDVDPDAVGIERDDFSRICPALIQQLAVKSCHTVHKQTPPISDVYLWGTVAVTVISVCSLIAILVIPCSGSCIFNTMMHFLIGLATSTLSGDALFHLLPEAMGLGGHHDENSPIGRDNFIYKLVAALATIYLCFLFEKIFRMCSRNGEESDTRHQNGDVDLNGFATDDAAMNTSMNNQNGSQRKTIDELLMEPLDEEQSCSTCKGLNSASLILLLADSVHNFMDGLAIGVAFTADFYVGVSTSAAILCHEVPHELGDFAVLLKNGMTKKMAVFWNFLSALFAFVGLYVGINLAHSEMYHPWIFAVIAGFFLYISLVNLTNIMLEDPPHNFRKSSEEDHPLDEENYQKDRQEEDASDGCSCSVFLFQNIALFIGWALMFTLAFYEDQLVH